MVDAAVQKIRQGGCDCAVVDLASPDSVARSTDPQALTRALGAIADAALTVGGALLVVGSANAEGNMACAYVSEPRRSLRPQGSGDDLAPTLLDLLQLPADPDSEGVSLLNPE
jgi:bisphosphoglycerate-independent phosphoglycerate mutase (AlkP superfamily)